MIVTINAVPSPGSPLPNPATFVLSPGGRESPNELSFQTTRNIQTRQFLRGPAVKRKDRGNAQTTVTFRVTRYFDTVSAAEDYILFHATTIPGGGTVVFQKLDGLKAYLTNACVQNTESKQIGRTTMHSYSLVGGLMSNQNIST